jgi:hypothetical protein
MKTALVESRRLGTASRARGGAGGIRGDARELIRRAVGLISARVHVGDLVEVHGRRVFPVEFEHGGSALPGLAVVNPSLKAARRLRLVSPLGRVMVIYSADESPDEWTLRELDVCGYAVFCVGARSSVVLLPGAARFNGFDGDVPVWLATERAAVVSAARAS